MSLNYVKFRGKCNFDMYLSFLNCWIVTIILSMMNDSFVQGMASKLAYKALEETISIFSL